MSLLFSVIYATHANGTHHKLALDALNKMESPQSPAWRRVFLKHAELYMQGSKAPDKEFKDFRNHVLHPGDDYWGGAPEKARAWYSNLVNALKEENWSEAVWCAGVLSHYYTDPIHPFHTAQSDAESAIHRGVEWSINRSYNELFALGTERDVAFDIEMPSGETWIEDLVCAGADRSNEDYERLIAHYDINIGASDPPAGLDGVARDLVSDLLIYASTGFARILDRAILEAGVAPPTVSLSVDLVLASLKIPLKWVLRKMDDAEDRATVQAMYDELTATGRVVDNLPADDRAVRDMHAREVLAPRKAKRKAERRRRVAKTASDKTRASLSRLSGPNTGSRDVPRVVSIRDTASRATMDAAETVGVADVGSGGGASAPSFAGAAAAAMASSGVPFRDTRGEQGSSARNGGGQRGLRAYLASSDELEKAPAIGAKTAERLAKARLNTVADLLNADVDAIASQVSHRYITSATLRDWQDFARLVMNVPGLRGTHAQLLAGAGYRSSAAIAQADPAELSADVLRFASTSAGNRILRDGAAPDIEKIKSWVESALQARAA